jgi:hypothetical protein
LNQKHFKYLSDELNAASSFVDKKENDANNIEQQYAPYNPEWKYAKLRTETFEAIDSATRKLKKKIDDELAAIQKDLHDNFGPPFVADADAATSLQVVKTRLDKVKNADTTQLTEIQSLTENITARNGYLTAFGEYKALAATDLTTLATEQKCIDLQDALDKIVTDMSTNEVNLEENTIYGYGPEQDTWPFVAERKLAKSNIDARKKEIIDEVAIEQAATALRDLRTGLNNATITLYDEEFNLQTGTDVEKLVIANNSISKFAKKQAKDNVEIKTKELEILELGKKLDGEKNKLLASNITLGVANSIILDKDRIIRERDTKIGVIELERDNYKNVDIPALNTEITKLKKDKVDLADELRRARIPGATTMYTTTIVPPPSSSESKKRGILDQMEVLEAKIGTLSSRDSVKNKEEIKKLLGEHKALEEAYGKA